MATREPWPAVAFQIMAAENAEAHREDLVELDVNPVLILEQGAIAVDAMIRLMKDK